MQAIQLKKVQLGDFLKRSETTNKVYIRGRYERGLKRYACQDTDDISREMLLKGETIVYIGFTY